MLMSNDLIVVIGCGGTGSWFVQQLGRLLTPLSKEIRGTSKRVILIDGDKVSESNVIRQNFCYLDIGSPKVFTMRLMLQQLYNVREVEAWCTYTSNKVLDKLLSYERHKRIIIISCVDNSQTRARITSKLKPDPDSWNNCITNKEWIYLDAGNTTYSGWSSSMCWINGEGHGTDMRQFDMKQRHPRDLHPTIDLGGQGCGSPNSSPNTYWGNQKNAYLLASQFRSLAKFNKAYGLITWSKPDFESTNWNQEEYIMQSLYPYQVNTR